MKNRSALITYSLLLITSAAQAAVTQRWEVETSRVQTAAFEAVRGETLALEAVFKSYGRPLEMPTDGCCLLWQTNGMGSAWWRAPAQVEGGRSEVGQSINRLIEYSNNRMNGPSTSNLQAVSNVVRAVFTPAMDPGADTVVGFLGATGQNYRASFRIRFRHGPGAVPNAIAGPVPILDLAHTVVVNPPWPTAGDFAATTTAMRAELKGYVDEQIEGAGLVTPQGVTNIAWRAASNVVTKAYVEGLGISGGGVTTNDVNAIIASSNLCTVAAADGRYLAMTNGEGHVGWNADGDFEIVTENNHKVVIDDVDRADASLRVGEGHAGNVEIGWARSTLTMHGNGAGETDGESAILNVGDDGETGGRIYVNGVEIREMFAPTSTAAAVEGKASKATTLSGYGITDAYTKAEADAAIAGKADATEVAQLGTAVTAIGAHLNAEDARFVSTNYDSVAQMPEAYVEIKMNNNWRTIWKEMTRWGKWLWGGTGETDGTWWDGWGGFHAWSTNVTAQLATKAERCWGIYDSETGEISPDGYTQISSSNILIAANMSYKRVVDTANAIWVLESNSGLATLGGTNGYFRVKDGDGNTQFEIVKGNLRELGCDAGGITVNTSGATPVLTIPYSVVAASHPTLKICTDLTTADWKSESEATCAATVSWSGPSGAYVATVTAKSNSSAMFVKATYMGGSETIINNIAPTKMQYIYIGNQKYAVGYATIGGTGVMTLTPQ